VRLGRVVYALEAVSALSPARVDLARLAERENEQVEWKENVADVDDVVATLSAFANDLQNLGGGDVVCGARDERDEHGFPQLSRVGLTPSRLREVELCVLARCRDRVSPPIAPLVTELPSGDPARRILVFVQPATGTAHLLRRDHDGGRHLVRVSRSTIEARNGLLRDLLVRKGATKRSRGSSPGLGTPKPRGRGCAPSRASRARCAPQAARLPSSTRAPSACAAPCAPTPAPLW
jgi:hypothetical protein